MEAVKSVGHDATAENSGGEEVAPFGDADQADNQNANDNNQAGGMAGPETGAVSALRHEFRDADIFVGAWNDFIERMTTERNVRFHGDSPFYFSSRRRAFETTGPGAL